MAKDRLVMYNLNIYHNAIRDHVDLLYRRGRTDRLIAWQVGNDEVHDPTLIAYRAYKNRNYADVVMVCAGTDRIGQPLPKDIIFLPAAVDLIAIKHKYLSEA